MPRKAKGLGLRKQGDHSAANMLRALRLTRSGISVRKASVTCGIAYATLRRYVTKHINVPSEHLATKKLTANYDHRRIFTPEQEEQLKWECEQAGFTFDGKDCRKVAYKMAVSNNLVVPNSWILNECAGKDWLRSFRERHRKLRKSTDQTFESELATPALWTPMKLKLEVLSSDDEGWINAEVLSDEDDEQLVNITEKALETSSEAQDGIFQEDDLEIGEIKSEVPDPIQQEELLTKEDNPPSSIHGDEHRVISTDTVDPLQAMTDTNERTVRTPRLSQKRHVTRDRTPSIDSIEEPHLEPRKRSNKQTEAQSLKRKMNIMEKEFRETQKRAKELHSLEMALMRERLREARAKADLAELLLQQQKQKASLQSSLANGNHIG